ncbi:MAG TPA: glycosyltransferase, partial [Streptosporangiaceae bacterium]
MKPVRIAVVIPAGPGDDIADTLASVLRYTDPSRIVVVVDDTSSAPEQAPDVKVIKAGQARPGTQGGLWVKTAPAYRWILDNYEPEMVLRLDADAVILGPGLEEAAEQAFRRNPHAGLLGAYRVGPDGGRRDFGPAARQLRAETG